MIRIWGIALFLFCSAPVFAMPEFLQMYRSDPFIIQLSMAATPAI